MMFKALCLYFIVDVSVVLITDEMQWVKHFGQLVPQIGGKLQAAKRAIIFHTNDLS